MTKRHKRIFLSVVVIATPAFAGRAILRSGAPRPAEVVSSDLMQTTDGAYRDGVFQGKLAAARGANPIPNLARWGSEKDRASFVTGYHEGYREQLNSRK
jgi:hypothetical protein